MEGLLPCYFLAEEDKIIVPAMNEGNSLYDGNKPEKGLPHPLGPRRTSLAAAFLNCIGAVDLTKFPPEILQQIKFFDEVADGVIRYIHLL